MPTEEEFVAAKKEFLEEYRKERASILTGGIRVSRRDIIGEKFPAKEDQDAFLSWADEEREKLLKKTMMPMQKPISRTELANIIDTMNYNDKLQRAALPYALLADQPFPNTNREIISPNVLGVNLNVQPLLPSHCRIANYSEESTLSNESDDHEESGFVFHQIGILEYFFPADKDEDGSDSQDESLPADFGVVVRIGRNGAPAGIYLIYDSYSVDPDIVMSRPTQRPNTDRWGELMGSHVDFQLQSFQIQYLNLR
ncbi:hypothetical protein FQN57_003324 [Myotisia sp. PD_48]|nr:hypothetical protein FQN57_003324 [Myotisia sp. PD_48]